MGYTHYWDNETFTDEQWAQLKAAAAAIFTSVRAKGIAIAGWDGKDIPTMDDERISFNGRDPDSFETCAIKRAADKFTFCKTGRRPYDTAVVALLICAERLGPLHWTSDGDANEHEQGRMLADRVLKRLNLQAA